MVDTKDLIFYDLEDDETIAKYDINYLENFEETETDYFVKMSYKEYPVKYSKEVTNYYIQAR